MTCLAKRVMEPPVIEWANQCSERDQRDHAGETSGMNHGQLYVCYMALFDKGWDNADIADALGITTQEASDIATRTDWRVRWGRCLPTFPDTGRERLVIAQRDKLGQDHQASTASPMIRV